MKLSRRICCSLGGRSARRSVNVPCSTEVRKAARKLLQESVGLVEGGGSGLMIIESCSGGRRVVRQRVDGGEAARERPASHPRASRSARSKPPPRSAPRS